MDAERRVVPSCSCPRGIVVANGQSRSASVFAFSCCGHRAGGRNFQRGQGSERRGVTSAVGWSVEFGNSDCALVYVYDGKCSTAARRDLSISLRSLGPKQDDEHSRYGARKRMRGFEMSLPAQWLPERGAGLGACRVVGEFTSTL